MKETMKTIIIATLILLTICFITTQIVNDNMKDLSIQVNISEGFSISGSYFENGK